MDIKKTTIRAAVGVPVKITLESNPTTGYSWSEQHDRKKIVLESKKFKTSFPLGETVGNLFGCGGIDIFDFMPTRDDCITEITFTYLSPCGDIERREVYEVIIGEGEEVIAPLDFDKDERDDTPVINETDLVNATTIVSTMNTYQNDVNIPGVGIIPAHIIRESFHHCDCEDQPTHTHHSYESHSRSWDDSSSSSSSYSSDSSSSYSSSDSSSCGGDSGGCGGD
jgi:predicted secreted protein